MLRPPPEPFTLVFFVRKIIRIHENVSTTPLPLSAPISESIQWTEQWENECDFCYLNQIEYECPSNPKAPETSDISTYVVSPATKAKFRFPSKDPDENIVIDNRNDAEKKLVMNE